MISSDIIRGHTDTMILFILYHESNYGYEISKRIRDLSKNKYVMKETTLYSTLKRLEANGYLESFISDKTSGKTRTYYRLTDDGKEYYWQRLKEWELTKEVVDQFMIRKD